MHHFPSTFEEVQHALIEERHRQWISPDECLQGNTVIAEVPWRTLKFSGGFTP